MMIVSIARKGIFPRKKGLLRLAEASGLFVPQFNTRIPTVNEPHTNLYSALLGWATNVLVVSTPYQTIGSFVADAHQPKYKNVAISFLRAPGFLPS